jgi:hypothetical protein
MEPILPFLAVFIPLLMGAAFLLGRHWHRRAALAADLSAVTQQHFDLIQGASLNQSVVEDQKTRFRSWLEQGEVEKIERDLRPGMHYVIKVRALTEIGTEDARRVLERQLHRRLTTDPLEQSWYWIDLASGLRNLNGAQSLPHLLRCSEAAGELPLGHLFAAETVCFFGFTSYLCQPASPLGRAALRTLYRALEGLRFGVQPHIVVEGRLGEAIEQLWDHRPADIDPLITRVLAEVCRQLRRVPHAEKALEEEAEREAFRWQMSRLASLEPAITDYLRCAPDRLTAQLRYPPQKNHGDVLAALEDLRAEAGAAVLPLASDPAYPHTDQAIRVLRWSRHPAVAPALRGRVLEQLSLLRRARSRPHAVSPRHPSVPPEIHYPTILRALRGHPSGDTEKFLILACFDWDPLYRAFAVSSLGWWEPFDHRAVLAALHERRLDANVEVRQAARAALARLGERQSLHSFRMGLASEDPQRVHETVQQIANEGLTLLWPDLDRIADGPDPDLAPQAREALERLGEDLGAGCPS